MNEFGITRGLLQPIAPAWTPPKVQAAAGGPVTTADAAARAGMTVSTFRGAMTRLRQAGGPDLRAPRDKWVDKRTPTYDEAALTAWLESKGK